MGILVFVSKKIFLIFLVVIMFFFEKTLHYSRLICTFPVRSLARGSKALFQKITSVCACVGKSVCVCLCVCLCVCVYMYLSVEAHSQGHQDFDDFSLFSFFSFFMYCTFP